MRPNLCQGADLARLEPEQLDRSVCTKLELEQGSSPGFAAQSKPGPRLRVDSAYIEREIRSALERKHALASALAIDLDQVPRVALRSDQELRRLLPVEVFRQV